MLVCQYCGSSNVTVDALVDPNSGLIVSILDSATCEQCRDETTLIEESEFLASQKGECSCLS